MSQIKIRIIPHTHWDKEWYFTNAKSVVYSLVDFDEVLDFLEKHDDFPCFLLDGQLSIVEEYLELHPHKKELLTNMVKKGKLIIGPWYTQPDTLVVSGENLIKNLEYGIELSKKYGVYQRIGYLPDSFGMCAQLPQIYKKFQFKYGFFRRGIAKHLVDNREFIWRALDGTQIVTHNLHHYGNMAYPPNDKNKIIQYFTSMVDTLYDSSKSDVVLLYNGEDQKPIRKNLPQIVEIGNQETDFDIKVTSLEEALDDVLQDYKEKNISLPTYQGEFTFGQYSRTHKSIFSTRADIKQLNNSMENFISNIVEPVNVLANTLGFTYERQLIDMIWKNMLLNSAHDSIGCCNSDATNFDIKNRFIQAKNLAYELVQIKLREIGTSIELKDATQFQVYNLLPYSRSGYVQVMVYSPYKDFTVRDLDGSVISCDVLRQENVTNTYLQKSIKEAYVDNTNSDWISTIKELYKVDLLVKVDKIPAFGYTTFYLAEASPFDEEGKKDTISIVDKQTEKDKEYVTISNEQYTVMYNHITKTLDLYSGDKVYNSFLYLMDDGDEGDSYDYSEPTIDRSYNSLYTGCTIHCHNNFEEMDLTGYISVPKNLKEREADIQSVQMNFSIKIILYKDGSPMQIDVEIINLADEHRLRLCFNTNRSNTMSLADCQFGTIERPTYLTQVKQWREEKWDEKPRTIEPFISYVSNGHSLHSIQVITEAVREYQFIGEKYNIMAITLFRSIPHLGKAQLNDRPGRESGTLSLVEDARLMNHVYKGRFFLHVADKKQSDITYATIAKEQLTPFVAYQAAPYRNNTADFVFSASEKRMLLPTYEGFVIDKKMTLSCVKKNNNDQFVMRAFNSSRNKIIDNLNYRSNHFHLDSEIDLLGFEVTMSEGVKPCEFKTFILNEKSDKL